MKKHGISRRDFLKGAAAGAATVAISGILGACASETDTTTVGTTAAPETTKAPETTAAETAAETSAAAEGGAPGGEGGGPGGPGGASTPVEPFVSSVTEDGRVKGYSGPGDWLGTAPVLTPDEDVETEIVVVGGGHSGVFGGLRLL